MKIPTMDMTMTTNHASDSPDLTALCAGSFQDVLDRAPEALKKEGFGIITRIDVQQTFAEKLGIEYRPYVILGACNPTLAHRALEAHAGAGLLLPCNVVVEQQEDGVHVSAVNPVTLLAAGGSGLLMDLALDARDRLARAVADMANP
jgi:uncharacterized protein (DUF302 family)